MLAVKLTTTVAAACLAGMLSSAPAMAVEDYQEDDLLFFEDGMIGCVTKHRGTKGPKIALVNKNGWSMGAKYIPFLADWLKQHEPYAFERDGMVVQLRSAQSETLRRAA